MTVLAFEQVTKQHQGSPPVIALDDATLTVNAGEMVAIIGPSGSGKSTLLSLAGTLERSSSGTVRFGGRDLDDLDDAELSALRSHQIGFVFQQFHLNPAQSTVDNVADGLLYQGVARRTRRAAAGDALEAVGLEHRREHRPSQLSGGECQRTAIARAIVSRPLLLLADEPTGSVDSAQGRHIMALLQDLNAAGTTLLIVTHSAEVAAASPRIISLVDGRVVSDTVTPRSAPS